MFHETGYEISIGLLLITKPNTVPCQQTANVQWSLEWFFHVIVKNICLNNKQKSYETQKISTACCLQLYYNVIKNSNRQHIYLHQNLR